MDTPQGTDSTCLHYKHANSKCETTLIRVQTRTNTAAVRCKDVICWIPDKTKTQYLATFAAAETYSAEATLRGFVYCVTCGKVAGGEQTFKSNYGLVTKADLAKAISYEHYLAAHLPVADSSSSESD